MPINVSSRFIVGPSSSFSLGLSFTICFLLCSPASFLYVLDSFHSALEKHLPGQPVPLNLSCLETSGRSCPPARNKWRIMPTCIPSLGMLHQALWPTQGHQTLGRIFWPTDAPLETDVSCIPGGCCAIKSAPSKEGIGDTNVEGDTGVRGSNAVPEANVFGCVACSSCAARSRFRASSAVNPVRSTAPTNHFAGSCTKSPLSSFTVIVK